jgi:DNA-binding response OmpR family regulator
MELDLMTHARAPTQPLSVLVVDGYPDSASSLVILLDLAGFTSRIALSGQEALLSAATNPPNAIVFEPRTPGVGWELVRRLADQRIRKRLFLVALTTETTLASRREATAIGVDLYLVKPERPTTLIRALRRFEHELGKSNPVMFDSPRQLFDRRHSTRFSNRNSLIEPGHS